MWKALWGQGVGRCSYHLTWGPRVQAPPPARPEESRDLQPGPGGQGTGIGASEADPGAGGGDVEKAGERQAGGDHVGQPGVKGRLVSHSWNP